MSDRPAGRPDPADSNAAADNQSGRAARLEELRQKGEERRIGRDAGQPAPGIDAVKADAPAGRPPRIIEGGPLKNPLGDSPVRGQPVRIMEDAAAQQPVEEMRQSAREQRATRDAQNAAQRVAPTPREVENRPPRVIERAPVNDIGAAREQAGRERSNSNRNDNPAPAARQQPVERPARTERAPVEQAPRKIERQVPVERTPPREVERRAPVERAPRTERESPRRRGKD